MLVYMDGSHYSGCLAGNDGGGFAKSMGKSVVHTHGVSMDTECLLRFCFMYRLGWRETPLFPGASDVNINHAKSSGSVDEQWSRQHGDS
jgi:hypothetical protein